MKVEKLILKEGKLVFEILMLDTDIIPDIGDYITLVYPVNDEDFKRNIRVDEVEVTSEKRIIKCSDSEMNGFGNEVVRENGEVLTAMVNGHFLYNTDKEFQSEEKRHSSLL